MSDCKIKHYAERFAKSQKKSMVQLLLIHNSYLQTGENFKSFLLLFERERRKEGDAFKSVYADNCRDEIILPF